MVQTQSVRERTEVHGTQETKTNLSNFKPFEAPRRRGGLLDNQVSISKHSISIPVQMVAKLGEQVALLFSDTDRAIAIAKNKDGGYKVRQLGKNKSTRAIYAKSLIEAKKIKSGRYSTSFDEKNQMLIARVQ